MEWPVLMVRGNAAAWALQKISSQASCRGLLEMAVKYEALGFIYVLLRHRPPTFSVFV